MSLLPSLRPPLRPAAPAPRLVVTPAVVAHRGASGYRREHTLDAYRTAVAMGADAVELDLVPTADGVLVVRHESELSRSTDVAEHAALAPLRTTKVIGGRPVTGWFTEDLTLDQVRTLTARERLPGLRAPRPDRSAAGVPTFAEVLAVLGEESARHRRAVGVLVELKDPAYFAGLGLPLEDPLLADLARHGLDRPRSGVTLMSFDPGVLRRLAARTTLPLVRLLDVGDDVGPAALDAVAAYAEGVGVHQRLVLPRTAGGRLGAPTRLVHQAHRRRLTVHAWTLRAENAFLPLEHRRGDDPAVLGDHRAAVGTLLDAGVDGIITDHPDLVLDAVRAHGRRT
ncbi:glycerophosphodiester phosphodiesterase family protein [Nocardioides pantholopis]|uniref:glycerophosphodiester phosphodiesterase family protein n=1 Tax=Nocardioides pantholopis TaxID=2483798 RepID=UPI000F07362E|nr:glycerophosphodiester phosphodiesterase family protein [Nocardioides pantholopis]